MLLNTRTYVCTYVRAYIKNTFVLFAAHVRVSCSLSTVSDNDIISQLRVLWESALLVCVY